MRFPGDTHEATDGDANLGARHPILVFVGQVPGGDLARALANVGIKLIKQGAIILGRLQQHQNIAAVGKRQKFLDGDVVGGTDIVHEFRGLFLGTIIETGNGARSFVTCSKRTLRSSSVTSISVLPSRKFQDSGTKLITKPSCLSRKITLTLTDHKAGAGMRR